MYSEYGLLENLLFLFIWIVIASARKMQYWKQMGQRKDVSVIQSVFLCVILTYSGIEM